MTVHALPSPVVLPAIVSARELLSGAAGVSVGRLAESEIAEGICEAAKLEAQAASLRLALTAEADARALATKAAATGTDAWAAALVGDTREAANGGVWVARLLREKYAVTREAFAAGEVTVKQVRVIVAAAEQIPDWATAEQVATAEEWLVARATGAATRSGRGQNPRRLRQTARAMCRVVSAELAEAHEAAMLGEGKRRADWETYFDLQQRGDGTWQGRFKIPELHGNLLATFLESLTSPRRLVRDAAGAQVTDETVSSWQLSYTEKLGVGLCELIEHLPAEGWKGRNGVDLVVTVGLESLRSGLGAATLDGENGGAAITAGEARRLACNAGIIPAVLGADSVPLDLGREQRLHDRYQRRALSLVHDTCAIVGCERPFAWCEIHHPHPWGQGGRTDLDNGLPLCFYHHRRAHDDQFDLRRHSQGEWRFHRRR